MVKLATVTLLTDEARELEEVYFRLIDELLRHGIRFAAASGRQYTNLCRLFAPVADEIDYICENGGLVVCGGRICYRQVIDRAYGADLLRALLDTVGCELLLSGVECCYVQPKDPAYAAHMRDVVGNDAVEVDDFLNVSEDYLKITAYFRDGVTERARQKLEWLAAPRMRPVVSGLSWLDFLPDNCNKGTALAVLQRELRVDQDKNGIW